MLETWLNRPRAYVEGLGDLRILQPASDQDKHIELSRRQFDPGIELRRQFLLGTAQPSQSDLGRAGRQPRRALRCGTNGDDNVIDRRVLRQEAARTRLERGNDIGIIGEHGEHDDARRWIALKYLACSVVASEIRHLQIHQDNLGSELGCQPDTHTAS